IIVRLYGWTGRTAAGSAPSATSKASPTPRQTRSEIPLCDADRVARGDRHGAGQREFLFHIAVGPLDKHPLGVGAVGKAVGGGDSVHHGQAVAVGIFAG